MGILSARAHEAAPPPLLTPTLRHHLIAGHRAAMLRYRSRAELLARTDPAAFARLNAEAARLAADIGELEGM